MLLYADKIKKDYFEWLYEYACKGRINSRISYRKLFILLHSIDFDFYIKDDVNRAVDGIDLRNRFAVETVHEATIYYHEGYNIDDITNCLDDPCSVLEMILALAIRCEETIMDNPDYGDRTNQWFWNMLANLGLAMMTDDNFDKKLATDRIYNFMERRYSSDGRGGLFYIRDCRYDLRDVDIWTQLCWYLNNFN